jgi:hypothetical protein
MKVEYLVEKQFDTLAVQKEPLRFTKRDDDQFS